MPSDGECHTEKIRPEDQFSDYVRTGNQDYPSIGLVRRRLEEKDIIPVFATFSDLESSYRVMHTTRAIDDTCTYIVAYMYNVL